MEQAERARKREQRLAVEAQREAKARASMLAWVERKLRSIELAANSGLAQLRWGDEDIQEREEPDRSQQP